ncbi:YgaB family protein [Bacillus kexueae]|uniref:YgaB family protein n=1 Tax=Aeribacillus kexueae TaxID=2078952 RepID=UPI001FAFF914
MNAVSRFDELVSEQLVTMEKLLFVQTEIERCQELLDELSSLEQLSKKAAIEEEIYQMKQELYAIQKAFEKKTEEVIHTYQLEQS